MNTETIIQTTFMIYELIILLEELSLLYQFVDQPNIDCEKEFVLFAAPLKIYIQTFTKNFLHCKNDIGELVEI